MVTLLCPAEHTSQQYATITRLKPTFCIFDVNWLGNIKTLGCHRRSVELSAPTILLPRVQVPSTPFMLLSFIELVLYLLCEKIENKQKEARFGPFKTFMAICKAIFLAKVASADITGKVVRKKIGLPKLVVNYFAWINFVATFQSLAFLFLVKEGGLKKMENVNWKR